MVNDKWDYLRRPICPVNHFVAKIISKDLQCNAQIL